MKKVFIINDSGHDFREAEVFGKLTTLTRGLVRKLHVTEMYRMMEPLLAESSPEDYLLQSGPTVLNMVAASIFAAKHGVLNLLIWDTNRYVTRTLVLKAQKGDDCEQLETSTNVGNSGLD